MKTVIALGFVCFAFSGFVGFRIGNTVGQSEVRTKFLNVTVECLNSIEEGAPDNWYPYADCLGTGMFKGVK